MRRKIFLSFRYQLDSWRVAQIKNIGTVDDSPLLPANDWEAVKRGGDTAIQRWIDDQMRTCDCTVVLIGSGTAGRRWVDYEIGKSWSERKGVLGIHIHGLKDSSGEQTSKGKNPFENHRIGQIPMSSIVQAYDTPYLSSTYVYDYIKGNLSAWVEEAIRIRAKY